MSNNNNIIEGYSTYQLLASVYTFLDLHADKTSDINQAFSKKINNFRSELDDVLTWMEDSYGFKSQLVR
mgnify:CR=1 FL=1